MSFIETPRFPADIARNAQRTRQTSTEVVLLSSGFEQRNQRWEQKRRRYDVGVAVRTTADYDEIIEWFEAMDGPATGFRFRDPNDNAATHSNGVLQSLSSSGVSVGTVGYGYGVPTMQLYRAYSRGAAAHYRSIRKPVSGGVALKRGGADVTLGASAGNAAVNSTTGVVTFVADQSRSVNSHTVGAAHVFNLSSAFSPNLSVGGRIYVTGVSGTAASIINGIPLEVTNVSSEVVTVSLNTTGLTATGGTAHFYPQPTETLTWAGTFDVPVRFETDNIDDIILQKTGSGHLLQAPSIVLIEIRT